MVSGDTLLAQSTMVFTSQANVYAFNAPGPGTLSIHLEDMTWPEKLQDLSFAILSPSSVLGGMSSAGDLSLPVGQSGLLYAAVTGRAGGTMGLGIGLYSLRVNFFAAGSPVPLPTAISLLLSGLGLLGIGRLLGSVKVAVLQPNPAV